MPPTFALPPKRHAPAPSLTLARNRSGPPSNSGSVGSDGGRAPKSPRSPRSPYANAGVGGSELDAVPLLPLSPVDAGAWAAENAYPPPRRASASVANPYIDEEGEEDAERADEATPRPTDVAEDRRRVQFAPSASVALFDAEDPETECAPTAFEPPHGRELLYVIFSVVGLSVFGVAAVLTTIYDWVL